MTAARVLLNDAGAPARVSCFLAQQAAEKALKAMLVQTQTPFRRTHDLVVLAGLQTAEVVAILDEVDLLRLHPWAVEARYPGDIADATRADAAEAVDIADAVISVAAVEIDLPPT